MGIKWKWILVALAVFLVVTFLLPKAEETVRVQDQPIYLEAVKKAWGR